MSDPGEKPANHNWAKNEKGEWDYIGPTELEISFDPALMLSPQDKTPVPSIKLTEPTAKHLSVFLAASRTQDDAAAGVAFISANVGVAPAYINKMRAREFNRAMDFLGGFTRPEEKSA